MTVWQLIASDIHAWRRHGFGDESRPLRLTEALSFIWRFTGLRATIIFRLSHAAHEHRIRGLPLLLNHRSVKAYGLDIMPSTPIGPGLYIAHPVGTIIGAQRIGANLNVTARVTIGQRNDGEPAPIIGDDVSIGSGAQILGSITVGDGATVGANAVVLGDVPAGAMVMAVPARVVQPNVITSPREAAVAAQATPNHVVNWRT